jgi:hypothetical protein
MFLSMISKVLFIVGLLSICLSIYVYQTNAELGTFIGLWVPTMLILSHGTPWTKQDNS